jgi:hypothetical protein
MPVKDPLQTLLEILNHCITQHPDLAPHAERIARSVLGENVSAGISEWATRAYAAPSPHFIKEIVLLRNGFPNAIWVETGTYLGQTTKELAKHGLFVYSIEPEPTLYSNASAFFQSFSNVEILRGFSEEILPSLLPKLSGDINFWLDGHYSGGVTQKGPQDTPILDELSCIAGNLRNFGNVCVMIDDIRCFGSSLEEFASYPSLKTLVDWAEEHNLGWHIEHDIFIAKSKGTPPQP